VPLFVMGESEGKDGEGEGEGEGDDVDVIVSISIDPPFVVCSLLLLDVRIKEDVFTRRFFFLGFWMGGIR